MRVLTATLVVVCITVGCGEGAPTTPTRTLTANWGLSVTASPSCQSIIWSGFGVAPRGGGTLQLTQTGNRLTGSIAMSGVPAGTLEGSVEDERVNFSIRFAGRNTGS
jgi:hypothetical protein